MSLIKKLTAFLMILPFVFGSFSPSRTAQASSYVPLSEYTGLFEALGFEIYPADGAVTRGQFVKNLISLMNFGSYSGNAKTFSDVGSDDAELYSAVEYAASLGIVSRGDNFYPSNPITYAEACKMTVEALGYGIDAKWRGGYPTGYFTVATSLDLDDGIDTTASFTAADMYMLLGNAANTNIKIMTSYNNNGELESCTLEAAEPMLEAYRDITRVSGIITASGGGYLYDSSSSIDNTKVMIDDIEYFVSAASVLPLGFYTDAYIKKDGSKKTLVYADISKNDVIRVSSQNISGFDGSVFTYYDESGKDKKVRFSDNTVVILNGKTFENYSSSDLTPTDGYVEFADNNSDGRIDVATVWRAAYLEVDYVNTYSNDYDYVFYDKNKQNNVYIKDDTYCVCDSDVRTITSGAFLETYISSDGSYVRINVLSDSVTGVLEGIGSDSRICINNTYYDTTAYFDAFCRLIITPGKSVSVITDTTGKAVALKTAGSSSMLLAYFDNMKRESGMDNSVMLKLFNENGEVVVSALDKKVVLNGVPETADNAYFLLDSSKGELIRYSSNQDGKIVKINTESVQEGIYEPYSDGPDTLKRFRFANDETDTKIYYKIFGYFVPYFTLTSQTKIICVSIDETNDAERFSIGTLSFLENDQQVASNSIRPYNVSVGGRAGAVLYKAESASNASVSVTSSSAVVAEMSDALDSEGNEVYKIKLYSSDKYINYFIKKDASFIKVMNLADGEYPYVTGDVIRYAIDDKGIYLLTAVKDFDMKTKTLLYTAGHNTELHYYYGQIYATESGSVAIKQTDGSIIYLPMSIGDSGIVEDGKIFTSPKEKITSYVQVGDDCHNILVRCRYSSPVQRVVYTPENNQ